MTRFLNSRISWKQAWVLGLVVSVIYFPVLIYIHAPKVDVVSAWRLLVFPALINLLYYTVFIYVADRALEKAELARGEKFLRDSQLPAIVVSILVAAFGTILSNYLFFLSLKIVMYVGLYFNEFTTIPTSVVLDNLKRVNGGVSFVISLSIAYLIYSRKVTIKVKSLELQSQQLANENAIAQFEALKNQVSPHFLFNSLSILSSLVHVNSDLSQKYIDKLSRAYRYILEQKDNDLIPLSTELDFINSYAFLVKMRFEDKFNLNVNVTPEQAMRLSIAPLTLQLLVENAVKHNRMSSKEPLHVDIFIDGDWLVIQNELRPREQHDVPVSTHVGLQNIKNRYSLLTEKPVMVTKDEGRFIVKIPLIA